MSMAFDDLPAMIRERQRTDPFVNAVGHKNHHFVVDDISGEKIVPPTSNCVKEPRPIELETVVKLST